MSEPDPSAPPHSRRLAQARVLLLVVGALNLVGAVVLYFIFEAQVDEQRQAGTGAEEGEIATIRLNLMLTMAVGLMILVLGVAVARMPAVASLTALLIFLALQVFIAARDPANMGRGLLLKIILIVGLIKAVQAAIAHERESLLQFRDASRSRLDT